MGTYSLFSFFTITLCIDIQNRCFLFVFNRMFLLPLNFNYSFAYSANTIGSIKIQSTQCLSFNLITDKFVNVRDENVEK